LICTKQKLLKILERLTILLYYDYRHTLRHRLAIPGVDCNGFFYMSSRPPGGDLSTRLVTFAHECPTLIGKTQLKVCSNQSVAVDQTNLRTWCGLLVQISLLEKFFHSSALQHSYSRILPLSFRLSLPCRQITPFHIPASFPAIVVKPPKRIVDSLAFTFGKKSFLSTESDNKILQSIHFAYKIGIISSYSNRIFW